MWHKQIDTGTLTLLGLSFLFGKMKTLDPMILSLLHLPIKQVTIELQLSARHWDSCDDQDTLGPALGAYILVTKSINKEVTSNSEDYQEKTKTVP